WTRAISGGWEGNDGTDTRRGGRIANAGRNSCLRPSCGGGTGPRPDNNTESQMKRIVTSLAAAAFLFAGVPSSAAEPAAREPKADQAYTWDLTDLFPTREAWDAAREQVLADLQKI